VLAQWMQATSYCATTWLLPEATPQMLPGLASTNAAAANPAVRSPFGLAVTSPQLSDAVTPARRRRQPSRGNGKVGGGEEVVVLQSRDRGGPRTAGQQDHLWLSTGRYDVRDPAPVTLVRSGKVTDELRVLG
jgi:hypothetical protein